MSGIKFSIGSMKESKHVGKISERSPAPENDGETSGTEKKRKIDSDDMASVKKLKNESSETVKPGGNSGIKIQLGAPKQAAETIELPKRANVASIFQGEDDSDEEEEMPPEAKMRMRNLGKDTPTSAGPNSFFKTRQGFTDRAHAQQKEMQQQIEELSEEK